MGVTLWPVSPSTKQLGLRVCSPEKYENLTLSDYLTVVLPGDMMLPRDYRRQTCITPIKQSATMVADYKNYRTDMFSISAARLGL